MYNFDKIIDRRNSYSLKWNAREQIIAAGFTERYDNETIPLFTADMDFPVADPIVQALHKTVEHRIYGYSIFPDEYYAAIEHWFKKKYDWTVKKEEVIYSPGTVHALHVAVRAFTNIGDGVIIQRPVYRPFTTAIEKNKRVVINNALIPDKNGRYTINFADFEEKAQDENTKLFILCNPHNPTGRIFTNEELQRLSRICKENNVILVADEIHAELIRRDQTFTPIAKIAATTEHIITCTAINKTFNVAGLHCSNIIISNPKLRKTFSAVMGLVLPSPFTIAALIAAYYEGDDWLEELTRYLDENIKFVKLFLAEHMPTVKVNIPEGTYVMWMDFRGYGVSPKEIHHLIYNVANIILEDGEVFGEEGTGFQRICVSSPRLLIKEALERIAKAFEHLENIMN